MRARYCEESHCLRKVFEPYIYCDKHQDNASNPSIDLVKNKKLLENLVDGTECYFDHNHSCQAHGYFYLEQGEMCPQYELKKLVESIK